MVVSPHIRWNTHFAVERGQPYAEEIDDLNQREVVYELEPFISFYKVCITVALGCVLDNLLG